MKQKHKLRFICCFFVLIFQAHFCFSQRDTLTLEEVVIRDVREQLISTGYKVIHADSLQLAWHTHQRGLDWLRSNTAALTRTYAPGMLGTLSLRGTGSEHTAILWNGIPMNQGQNGLSDLSLFPVFLFDDVSLRYGGGASLFGSAAIGGVLAFGNQLKFNRGIKSQAWVSAGSFGERNMGLKLSVGNEKMAILLPVVYSSLQNNYPYNDLGNRLQNSASRLFSFMPSFQFQIRKQTQVVLTSWIQQSQRQLPNPVFSLPGVAIQNDSSLRQSISLKHKSKFGLTSVKAGLTFDKLFYQDSTLNLSSHIRNRTIYAEGNHVFLIGARIVLDAGLSYKREKVETDAFSKIALRSQMGLFSRAKYTFKRVQLEFQIRKDFVKSLQTPLLPSLGLEWNFHKYFSLRSNLNRSFNLPTLNMLYWQPGGNLNLKPEKGWSGEVGLAILVPLQKWNFKIEVCAFGIFMQNWIQWMPGKGGYWSPQNLKSVFSRGLETEISLSRNWSKWKVNVNLNNQLTRSTNFSVYQVSANDWLGKQLVFIPLYYGSSSFFVERRNLFLTTRLNFSGPRFTTADNGLSIPGYVSIDVGLGKCINFKTGNLSIEGRINNLGGKNWEVYPGRPMPGRAFLLSLSWENEFFKSK